MAFLECFCPADHAGCFPISSVFIGEHMKATQIVPFCHWGGGAGGVFSWGRFLDTKSSGGMWERVLGKETPIVVFSQTT